MWRLELPFRRPQGMRGLFMIWLGQMVSGIASSITAVALPIWIFSITESGTAVALLEFFFFGSYLLAVLFAGILIDRSDRKTMMLMYDFLSLSGLAVLLVLQTAGLLQIWHLYVSAVFQGVGSAFQAPSYAAAITTMVSRKQYIRANSLMSLLYDLPGIFGPLLAGMTYMIIGLSGILAVNLIAFVISIGVLLFVEVPPTPRTIEGELSHNKFLNEAIYGIKYIFQRPGLLGVGRVPIIWLIAIVFDSIFDPIINVSIDAFLQAKVLPDLQGRVFSASDFIAQAMIPFAPLLAGYFGDRVFEPAMQTGGALVNTFGWLVGTGPGSGFGLLILLCGVGGILVGLSGYLITSIRNIDRLLLDFRRVPPIGMIKRFQSVR